MCRDVQNDILTQYMIHFDDAKMLPTMQKAAINEMIQSRIYYHSHGK